MTIQLTLMRFLAASCNAKAAKSSSKAGLSVKIKIPLL